MLARYQQGNVSGLLVAHVAAVLAGYLATFAFGALAIWATLQRLWGGWTARRATSLRSWGWGFSLIGLLGCIVGVGLGMLWTRENRGAFWTNDLRDYGGLALILWNGLALWLLPRRHKPLWADLVLGLGGNVTVALGWLVASMLAHVNEHGETSLLIFLKVFFVTHAILLILPFVPPRGKDRITPESLQ
jgi:hypothetical protein